MRMYVRGEHVRACKSLGEILPTPSRSYRIRFSDPCNVRSPLEDRIAELMTAEVHSGRTEQGRHGGIDLDVAQRLQCVAHDCYSGDDRCHRPEPSFQRANALAEVHQATTFRIDGTAPSHELAHTVQHRRVRRKLMRSDLGVATAEIKPIHFGKVGVARGRKVNKLCP